MPASLVLVAIHADAAHGDDIQLNFALVAKQKLSHWPRRILSGAFFGFYVDAHTARTFSAWSAQAHLRLFALHAVIHTGVLVCVCSFALIA